MFKNLAIRTNKFFPEIIFLIEVNFDYKLLSPYYEAEIVGPVNIFSNISVVVMICVTCVKSVDSFTHISNYEAFSQTLSMSCYNVRSVRLG